MKEIGQIKELRLTDVWKREATDFTPWLYENIQRLSDAIGVPIKAVAREKRGEDFICDIVAQDNKGRTIVIENQFGVSNHDHLGKIVTYATVHGANYAIWIVETAHKEHCQVIDTLNQTDGIDCSFYLIEAKVYQIGDSIPAIQFNVICQPQKQSAEPTPAQILCKEFWTQFISTCKVRNVQYFTGRTANSSHWMDGSSIKVGGIWPCIHIARNRTTIKIVFQNERKVQQFPEIYSHRTEIEESVGESLEWVNDESKVFYYLSLTIDAGYDSIERSKWNTHIDNVIDKTLYLIDTVSEYIGCEL